MMRVVSGVMIGIVCLCACHTASARAQTRRRTATDAETRTAIEALLRAPAAPLSEDPSCKSDLSQPGSVSIAQGLGAALLQAVTDKKPVNVMVQCSVRPGYPLQPGEEWCRLAFVQTRTDDGYGLAFAINWKQKSVRPGTVECF